MMVKDQLKRLNQLIHGPLSPAHYCQSFSKLYLDPADHAIPYRVLIQVKVRREESEKYTLVEHREHVLTNAIAFSQPPFICEQNMEQDIEELKSKFQLAVTLSSKDVRSYAVATDKHTETLTMVSEQKICSDTPAKERYCFYHALLSEIMEQVIDQIHELESRLPPIEEKKEILTKLYSMVAKLSCDTRQMVPLDQLYAASGQELISDVYILIYQHVENLLCYLYQYYPTYIDKDTFVPFHLQFLLAEELDEKIMVIDHALATCIIDKELKSVLDRFISFYPSKILKAGITFHKLDYYVRLVDRMYGLAIGNIPLDRQGIIDGLFEYNFNSAHFFALLTKEVEKQVKEQKGLMNKINHLCYLLKIYNQKQVTLGLAYQENMPGIKEQLTDWIKEEILFYKRQSKISILHNIPSPKPSVVKEASIKLKSSLSVAGLAYLFKVLYETGIITSKNQRDLSRFISAYWRTSKTEQISYDSANSKYYNVEESTRLTIKDALIKMLNYVNQAK